MAMKPLLKLINSCCFNSYNIYSNFHHSSVNSLLWSCHFCGESKAIITMAKPFWQLQYFDNRNTHFRRLKTARKPVPTGRKVLRRQSQIAKSNRIRFVHDHLVNGGPDPDLYKEFCSKLIKENFSVIKVEMATKSLTRTVKDQRYNLVSKISSLG